MLYNEYKYLNVISLNHYKMLKIIYLNNMLLI